MRTPIQIRHLLGTTAAAVTIPALAITNLNWVSDKEHPFAGLVDKLHVVKWIADLPSRRSWSLS